MRCCERRMAGAMDSAKVIKEESESHDRGTGHEISYNTALARREPASGALSSSDYVASTALKPLALKPTRSNHGYNFTQSPKNGVEVNEELGEHTSLTLEQGIAEVDRGVSAVGAKVDEELGEHMSLESFALGPLALKRIGVDEKIGESASLKLVESTSLEPFALQPLALKSASVDQVIQYSFYGRLGKVCHGNSVRSSSCITPLAIVLPQTPWSNTGNALHDLVMTHQITIHMIEGCGKGCLLHQYESFVNILCQAVMDGEMSDDSDECNDLFRPVSEIPWTPYGTEADEQLDCAEPDHGIPCLSSMD